jgi:hypothetical protein
MIAEATIFSLMLICIDLQHTGICFIRVSSGLGVCILKEPGPHRTMHTRKLIDSIGGLKRTQPAKSVLQREKIPNNPNDNPNIGGGSAIGAI